MPAAIACSAVGFSVGASLAGAAGLTLGSTFGVFSAKRNQETYRKYMNDKASLDMDICKVYDKLTMKG